MAKNKTIANDESVDGFLHSLADEKKRKDCFALIGLLREITGLEPKMWGSSIIGFGTYHYKYESGREGDMMIIGFSPRKQNIALYLKGGAPKQSALLQKLGKHKTGAGCLYINSLADIDQETLKKMFKVSFSSTYP